jgi:tetratricopeptide (TPR) repeat protein/energy-coupling factor transporter ATP-binding protein EcfA2
LSPEWPFPGLRPFAFPDSEFFFGRDDQKYALYRMLARNRFVAVVGSSGSGKSSLVFAALQPLLEKENQEYRSKGRTEGAWIWTQMRPGRTPLLNLTKALARLSADTDEEIARARHERIAYCLQLSSHGIGEAMAEMESFGSARLVIVVDQFEELFRFARSHETDEKNPQNQSQSLNEAETFVQLLIQATRSGEPKAHVLITMRSDFIGDCAYFRGLPELVSGAQFLVPGVSRGQCEEIIREPLAKSGSSIEPELVTSLLNDSGGQFDQLPVLQHCLLRLWEKAAPLSGAVEAANSSASVGEPDKLERETPIPRHLTLAHYNSIGCLSGALSQHANEIMARLPGRAVEKTFRALAEIDRDGRAIRRSLLFRQLKDEVVGRPNDHTGISEADLQQVLKRFCADGCSFLASSSDVESDLSDNTSIDVSHEALLRRWDRVSGKPDATDPAGRGWLRIEVDDGQRYRHLLMTDTLHSREIRKEWDWWTKLRPTATWARRYGDGYDRVLAMLRRSRIRRRIMIGFAAGAILLIIGAAIRFQQVQYNAASDKNFLAIESAKQILDIVIKDMDSGVLTFANAHDFWLAAETIVNKLTPIEETSEIMEAHAEFLAESSDLFVAIAEMPDALKYAESAKMRADVLVRRDPGKKNWQLLQYRALFRVGDVQDYLLNPLGALQTYHEALNIVEPIFKGTSDDFSAGQAVAFIRNKLGDVETELKDYPSARSDYDTAVSIMEQLHAKTPDNSAYTRDLASSYFNMAELLSAQGQTDEALTVHRKALEYRSNQLAQAPGNPVYLGHVAESLVAMGKILMQRSQSNDAIAEFRVAVEYRQKAADIDSANLVSRSALADALSLLGDAIKAVDNAEANDNYNKALAIRKSLVEVVPDNPKWQQALKVLQDKISLTAAKPN